MRNKEKETKKTKKTQKNIFEIDKIRLLILSFSYPICESCNCVKTKNNNKYCLWCGFQISRIQKM